MADNKILVFGENAAAEDYLTDAEYSTNEIRSSGNVVGLARRKPNNKALKQSTLMASALAQVLADDDGEWAGTEINDSLTPAGIKGIFKNYLETKIDSFTRAISLFSNERYEYDEDTDYLPTDVRTYNGELYICKQANGVSSTVVAPGSDTAYWQRLDSNGAIGEIKWFAFNTAPDGYLVCNGANVSRTTYADLFAVIGTTFGSGDGSTTFTLPNLIDKFAQGSTTVGTVKSAGLPNITGKIDASSSSSIEECFGETPKSSTVESGALSGIYKTQSQTADDGTYVSMLVGFTFDASKSNSIYGNSTTVQPPALTLLPCIRY